MRQTDDLINSVFLLQQGQHSRRKELAIGFPTVLVMIPAPAGEKVLLLTIFGLLLVGIAPRGEVDRLQHESTDTATWYPFFEK